MVKYKDVQFFMKNLKMIWKKDKNVWPSGAGIWAPDFQQNFPAHALNFHGKWGAQDQIKIIF